jgi:hypothetical protein
MIGFYFINKEKKETGKKKDIQLSLLPYEDFKNLKEIKRNIVYLFTDPHAAIKQKGDYTLYSIGTLVYQDTCNEDALEIIGDMLVNGKAGDEWLQETHGQFCLIIHRKEEVLIITDKAGIFPLYICHENNVAQVTNIFPLICSRNPLTLNYQGIAEFLGLRGDAYCINETFFNEIKLLDMGMVYSFGQEKRKACNYYDICADLKYNKYDNVTAVSEKVKRCMMHNLSFLNSDHKRIYADITGGFDTQLNAVLLKENGTQFTSGLCGEQIEGEAAIARKIARVLQVPLREDIRIKTIDQFRETVNLHYTLFNGVPLLFHTSEIIYYFSELKNSYDIHINGFGGTEMLVQYYKPLTLLSPNLHIPSFLAYHFPYCDIFSNGKMTKKIYYKNLSKKVKKSLNILGTKKMKDAASALIFLLYSRFWHGAVMGVHNCLFPHYSPYFEADFIKMMFETAYTIKKSHDIQKIIISHTNRSSASIVTTHGYTAEIREKKPADILYMIKNTVKDAVRRILYRFGVIRSIKKVCRNIMLRFKPAVYIEDNDRLFWHEEVQKKISGTMLIFSIIDKKKYNNIVRKHLYKKQFCARIVYLDTLFKELQSQIKELQ